MVLAPEPTKTGAALESKAVELKESESTDPDAKEIPSLESVAKATVPVATKPLLKGRALPSRFSIHEALEPKVETNEDKNELVPEKDLPTNHFSQSDIDQSWKPFLEKVKAKDNLIYNAIAGFRLEKTSEDTITVHHASQTARAEFERIQGEFFGPFKQHVNHHKINVEYKRNKKLKKEIITKRKLFEKMSEENPVLKELDEYFKLDLS